MNCGFKSADKEKRQASFNLVQPVTLFLLALTIFSDQTFGKFFGLELTLLSLATGGFYIGQNGRQFMYSYGENDSVAVLLGYNAA